MTKFLYKNRYKFVLVLFLGILLISLTSCRMDSGSWYSKPYTTYAQEWIDLWNGGAGFWNTLWGWPINILSFPRHITFWLKLGLFSEKPKHK